MNLQEFAIVVVAGLLLGYLAMRLGLFEIILGIILGRIGLWLAGIGLVAFFAWAYQESLG